MLQNMFSVFSCFSQICQLSLIHQVVLFVYISSAFPFFAIIRGSNAVEFNHQLLKYSNVYFCNAGSYNGKECGQVNNFKPLVPDRKAAGVTDY